MPRVELSFADGFYVSQSPTLIDKRVVNAFPIIPQADAVTKRALLGTPGISAFADFGTGTSRGVLVFSDGKPYRVLGNFLVSVDSAGVFTNHGTIGGNSDVSMASNGINISIQDPNGQNYFFTPGTSTFEINFNPVFLSFGQAKTVTFKDGFYAYTTKDIFFSSSPKTVNDGKNFNALDFTDAEISPDKIIKGHNNHNQLYILGENTTEVYATVATTGFPFQRIPGAIIQKGCSAPNSVIDFDNSFVFIGGAEGEKPAIWKSLGSSVQKISNASIDNLIQNSSEETIFNARAWSYGENGDYFAVFTVGNNTLVYDAATSALSGKPEWHERQTGITGGDSFMPWRAIHGVKVFGEIQVADDRTARLGNLDFAINTEYGDTIERIFSTGPFVDRLERIFSREIELLMQVGVGDATTPDPQIRMAYSDDGSNNYNSEISKPMGKVGEFKTRVRWSRLGSFPKTRTLRFIMTDPVPFNVYGLYANAESTNSG